MVKGQVLLISKALLYKRAINTNPGRFFIRTVNKKGSPCCHWEIEVKIDHFTEGFVTELYNNFALHKGTPNQTELITIILYTLSFCATFFYIKSYY